MWCVQLIRLEEVNSLELWTVSCICRCLSLPNVIALVNVALLERPTVVVCPNSGILSATVLSLIPMLRPFTWQSVMLPSLPNDLLGLMDAPVPFVVGVEHKSPEVRARCGHLCRVNVYKNSVQLGAIPPLPGIKELTTALAPYHKRCAHGPLPSPSPSTARHPLQRDARRCDAKHVHPHGLHVGGTPLAAATGIGEGAADSSDSLQKAKPETFCPPTLSFARRHLAPSSQHQVWRGRRFLHYSQQRTKAPFRFVHNAHRLRSHFSFSGG